MKKVKNPAALQQASVKQSRNFKVMALSLLVVTLIIAAFGLGLAVPGMMNGTGTGSDERTKLDAILSLLETNWYYAKDASRDDLETRLIEQAITGMTTLEEDPHTNYFNLEEAKLFSESLAGSNVGIGVSFIVNDAGNMLVKRVFTNSTADKAGLKKGDEITQVGDLVAAETSTDDLVSFIKSQDGKEVPLQVMRDGETLEMTVTPGSYDSTVSDIVADGYGEIILNSFSENSGQEFTEAAGRMQAAGIKNLILDLRNNKGGYVSAAQEIASSLLPDDTVVMLEDTGEGEPVEFKTIDNYAQVDFDRIYILQNENTASASEVLIGALKDNLPEDKVVTIGTSSYGKGTEQRTIPFADGTSMKYTIAEWLTPNGTSINKVGFTPDIEVQPDIVQTTGYRTFDEGETIEPDSVNDNAAAIQVFLQFLGYPADRTDYYFSAASSEALKQFQSDEGLEATGIADQATLDKLVEKISAALVEQEEEIDTIRIRAIEEIQKNLAESESQTN